MSPFGSCSGVTFSRGKGRIFYFLTAINAGEAPSPSFEEGLHVQRVLAAIEESANNKSTVTRVDEMTPAAKGS